MSATRRLWCRECGRADVIRGATGEAPQTIDLISGAARIPLTGFPVGWRMYEWRCHGALAHAEARCPGCPDPTRKDGRPDTDAIEVDRS